MRIDKPRFSRLLLIIFLLNILAAQIVHEAGHWAVLQAFGRRPLWGFTSLVQLSEKSPSTPADWVQHTNLDGSLSWLHLQSSPASDVEWLLFLAAGPLIQLAAVAAGILLARSGRTSALRTIGFLIALVNAFGGLFYQIVSLLRGGGSDETLIAHYLSTTPIVVSAVLGAGFGLGLVITFRALRTWKTMLMWTAALMVGIFPVGPLLMISNSKIIEQVDAGNPLFQPVLGFSLPVFLTGLVCLLSLVFVVHKWEPTPSDI